MSVPKRKVEHGIWNILHVLSVTSSLEDKGGSRGVLHKEQFVDFLPFSVGTSCEMESRIVYAASMPCLQSTVIIVVNQLVSIRGKWVTTGSIGMLPTIVSRVVPAGNT